MKSIDGIYYYTVEEMQKATGKAERTLQSWQYPVKVKDPSDRRVALYNFKELKPKYQKQIIAKLGNPDAKPEPKEPELPWADRNRKEIGLAHAKYNLVKQYRVAALNAGSSKVETKKEWVNLVHLGLICQDEFEKVGRKLSFKTIERWDKMMRAGKNTMDDLLPKQKEKSGFTDLTEAHPGFKTLLP